MPPTSGHFESGQYGATTLQIMNSNYHNLPWTHAYQLHLANQHATTTLWINETPVEPNMDQYLELHKIVSTLL